MRVLMLTVMLCCAPAIASSAEMTARGVTTLLHASAAGGKPDLSKRDLSGLDLSDLDFKQANLDGANLYGCDLSRANLANASLRDARLDRATIIDADFSGADLTGARILRPNVFADLDGAWQANRLTFANARMANAHLHGTFDGANFSGADLTAALFGPRDPREEQLITPMMSLIGAKFDKAILAGADFSRNDLRDARFAGADLSRANMRETRVEGADFTGALVPAADFTGAELRSAVFSGARGMDSAIGLTAVAQR